MHGILKLSEFDVAELECWRQIGLGFRLIETLLEVWHIQGPVSKEMI
jgi:hypothetical protein